MTCTQESHRLERLHRASERDVSNDLIEDSRIIGSEVMTTI
jgi:hypothetical protein